MIKNVFGRLIDTLAELLKVKSIVTLALVGCTVYLAVNDRVSISPEAFLGLITAVVTYYFTRKDT